MTKYVDASPLELLEGRLLPSDLPSLALTRFRNLGQDQIRCIDVIRSVAKRNCSFFDRSKAAGDDRQQPLHKSRTAKKTDTPFGRLLRSFWPWQRATASGEIEGQLSHFCWDSCHLGEWPESA
jgi:hypothetical protein